MLRQWKKGFRLARLMNPFRFDAAILLIIAMLLFLIAQVIAVYAIQLLPI
jgi:hypothetical protein